LLYPAELRAQSCFCDFVDGMLTLSWQSARGKFALNWRKLPHLTRGIGALFDAAQCNP
jgi:hypothetical protein